MRWLERSFNAHDDFDDYTFDQQGRRTDRHHLGHKRRSQGLGKR